MTMHIITVITVLSKTLSIIKPVRMLTHFTGVSVEHASEGILILNSENF